LVKVCGAISTVDLFKSAVESLTADLTFYNNSDIITTMKTQIKVTRTGVRNYTILSEDFTLPGNGISYKKGTRFPTSSLQEVGIVITMGHGLSEVIPLDLFKEFTESWTEVTRTKEPCKPAVEVRVKHCEDRTALWLAQITAMWKTKDAVCERDVAKARVSYLRKIISLVESGKAEKELRGLVETLNR